MTEHRALPRADLAASHLTSDLARALRELHGPLADATDTDLEAAVLEAVPVELTDGEDRAYGHARDVLDTLVRLRDRAGAKRDRDAGEHARGRSA